MTEHVINITNVRDGLGIICQHVARTDEPVIVRRYKREDVAIVPLWEWRFLKQVEAAIRAGQRPWEDATLTGEADPRLSREVGEP